MAGKNFKSNKPQDTAGNIGQTKTHKATQNNQNSENENATKKKTNGDYLRLDILGYKDFLFTMAGFRKMSVTKYIHRLIDADMEKNKEIYKKIKNI